MRSFEKRLLQVMEKHYPDDTFRATNLHKLLAISRSALHYKLKNQYGMSTAVYMADFRIRKALPLLIEGEDSIKLIAFEVGFRDPNYFSRVFRHTMGMSPKSYRRATNHVAITSPSIVQEASNTNNF